MKQNHLQICVNVYIFDAVIYTYYKHVICRHCLALVMVGKFDTLGWLDVVCVRRV